MNPIRTLLGCGLLLGALAPAWAETAAEVVSVEAPYVRAVPPGQRNSAAFMGLNNAGDQDHALVSARSPVAEAVELHTHSMRDGMMSMRPVERVDLPARDVVSLQPGGLHVMLIGLRQRLELGQEVPLTLVFEDGSERQLGAPVQKINVEAMQHHHH